MLASFLALLVRRFARSGLPGRSLITATHRLLLRLYFFDRFTSYCQLGKLGRHNMQLLKKGDVISRVTATVTGDKNNKDTIFAQLPDRRRS